MSSVLSKLLKVYTDSLLDEKVKLRDNLIEKIKDATKQEELLININIDNVNADIKKLIFSIEFIFREIYIKEKVDGKILPDP